MYSKEPFDPLGPLFASRGWVFFASLHVLV